jgi:hypothetical protein
VIVKPHWDDTFEAENGRTYSTDGTGGHTKGNSDEIDAAEEEFKKFSAEWHHKYPHDTIYYVKCPASSPPDDKCICVYEHKSTLTSVTSKPIDRDATSTKGHKVKMKFTVTLDYITQSGRCQKDPGFEVDDPGIPDPS